MLSVVSFPSTNHSLLTSTVNFPSRFKSTEFRCRAAAVTVAPSELSLYEVLGVRRNASTSEIKTAYRSLAKRYHPDANSTAPEEDSRRRRCFVEINDAYETLSDSDARAVYDSSIGLLGSNGNATSFGGGLSSVIVGPTGYRINPTRKWETDQCW